MMSKDRLWPKNPEVRPALVSRLPTSTRTSLVDPLPTVALRPTQRQVAE